MFIFPGIGGRSATDGVDFAGTEVDVGGGGGWDRRDRWVVERGAPDPGHWAMDPGPQDPDPGPCTQDPAPRTLNPDPVLGPWPTGNRL